MSETPFSSSTEDLVVAQFLQALETGDDAAEVIRRFSERHPNMGAEFRALALTRRAMDRSSGPDPAAVRHPERLGDFRIVRPIGHGGMGEIYEAVQEPFGRRVAVKTIRGDHRHLSPPAQARFLREQEVLARLHHTHIVPIHAGGREGDLQYFAMPYIDGAALQHVVRSVRRYESSHPGDSTPSLAEVADVIAQARERDGRQATVTADRDGGPSTGPADPLAPAVAKIRLSTKYLRSVAKVMADAAEALEHAHREARVIHRDVKPSNLMVDKLEHCWVLDFGLAGYHTGSAGPATTPAGAEPAAVRGVMGTPHYMAPEQFDSRADERTDVWGLGVTLYELLTLRRAFGSREAIRSHDPPRPRDLVANLPRDLEAICWKAIRKAPDHRYQSAGEVGEELRRWFRHEPVSARPAHALRRAGLWARRNPGWAAALAVALIAAVVFGLLRVQQAQAKAAEAEARVRRQNLQQIRLSAHTEHWSKDLWEQIGQEAHNGDEDGSLQALAAASCAGMDVRTAKQFLDFGAASLAFDPADPTGHRLLMGGVTEPRNYKKPLPSRLWDGDARPVELLSTAEFGPVGFRADGTPIQLADEAKDGALTLMDLRRGQAIRRFEIPGKLYRPSTEEVSVGMLADGSLVGAPVERADGTPALVAWDGETGRQLGLHPGQFLCVAFAPDRSVMAGGDADGLVVVWSLATGRELASFECGRLPIYCLTFHRDPRTRSRAGPGREGDGWLLAAGGAGGGVTVLDVAARRQLWSGVGSLYDVYTVAFSPDGTLLATSGRGFPRLWDARTGRLLLELHTSGSYVLGLAFSADGRRLAIGTTGIFGSGEVRIVDLEDGRGVRTLRGLARSIESGIL